MDVIDRFQLSVRYCILSFLSLFGYTNSVTFNNQLRKVSYIINSNVESDSEISSAGSSSCYVVEDVVNSSGQYEDSGSDSTGESTQEVGSEENVGGQSDGSEDIE